MPQFLLLCRDKPDSVDLRMATREAHLAYIAKADGNVLLAGPMLDDNGRPVGSLLIIDAEDRNAANAFAEADPYAKASLFEDVEVRPYKLVTGKLLAKEV